MEVRKNSKNMMGQDKGLWSTMHLAVIDYARKCRRSYLSMFSF